MWTRQAHKMKRKADRKVAPVKNNLRLHELVHQVGHVISGCDHLQRRVVLVHSRHLKMKDNSNVTHYSTLP